MLTATISVTRFTILHRSLLRILLISIALVSTTVLADVAQASSHESCFAVADERALDGGGEDHQDTLTRLSIASAETEIIGLTGTTAIEAITFGPSLRLYAADGGQLGTLNLMTGAFTPLSQPFGEASGSFGDITLTDVDGLAYSLDLGIFFGTHRRSGAELDILFAINPVTGAHIPDYFGPADGPKTDYVPVSAVVDGNNNTLWDVDDIQFHPVTGVLNGAMNTGGGGGMLVTIDLATGTATQVATFRYAQDDEVIDDIEGISFSNNGTLYASTGDNYDEDLDDLNKLFQIDAVTGAGALVGPFPVGPQDYEALACLTFETAIVLKKYTNGPGQAPADADTPTGPIIAVDAPVTWTYIFTNTSVLTLTNLSLTDDQLGVITPSATNSCLTADTILAPGRSLTCTATGVAEAGQYSNIGTITGQTEPGLSSVPVTDTDPSHYFGALPGIDIIKFTNGADANAAPGPALEIGSTVTWTYEVRNTGNIALGDIVVEDDQPGVTPLYISGDLDGDNLLDLTEVWLFRATGTVVEGPYVNMGTVTSTPPATPPVTDTDPSHYFGALPGIDIIKFTNGEDANTPTGPILEVGSTVTWTYEVRNTGNVALSDIAVVDDQPGVTPLYISGDLDGDDLLDVTEVWLFRATGIAVAGQYINTGTVTGTPPVGPNVTDTDLSHYIGVDQIPPTNLPTEEQPRQNRGILYMPLVESGE